MPDAVFSRRLSVATLVVAALLAPSAISFAKGDTTAIKPPVNDESWYVVTIRGQQCGYLHEQTRTVGDEVHSDSDTQIAIKRDAVTVKMRMERSYRETIDGKPLGFRAVQTLGTMPQTIEGVVKDGKISLTSSQPGGKFENSYDFDPDCLFSWGQMIQSHRHGLAPGTEYEVKTYDPSVKTNGPITMRVHIHGKDDVDVLGKTRSLHRLTSSLKIESSNVTVDSEIWVDDDFTPIITTVDLGPISMKMYRTTKEAALKEGAPPEMFLDTIISANSDVSRDAQEVRYRIQLRPGGKNTLADFPDTDMQTFKRIDDRSAFITVRRTDWKTLKNVVDAELTLPEAIKPFLKPSAVCDSGYRKIKRMSIKASRPGEVPTTRADKMRKYVTDYISRKGLDVGFATATEVAETRGGDCTEHAVLLAAVARASGIPARGVGGLVGVPSSFRKDAKGPMDFGFHMWTQVYIHGKWVDIDAAMRQTDCDPTHIALSIIPLGDGDMMGDVWNIIPMLGQLEIEIVKVTE